MNTLIVLFLYGGILLSVLVSIALLLLLRSPGMQRWGRPEATMPKFSNLYQPTETKPRAVSFFIDHAPQDRRIAADLSKGLIQYGHQPAADLQSAEAVFALISRFQTDTQADPEHQVVYPVLVQTATPSEKLSRVQWIDFRKGVRNVRAIAQLLPQPAKMLSALGVRPASGTQVILPGIIKALMIFLTVLLILDVTSFSFYILQLWYLGAASLLAAIPGAFVQYALFMIPIAALAYVSIRALRERQGWPISIAAFLFAQFVLLVLVFWQTSQAEPIVNAYTALGRTGDAPMMTLGFPIDTLMFGDVILGLAALVSWKDIHRWFPAKIRAVGR